MHSLELLAIEKIQEESRMALAEHCEQVGQLRRALRGVLESHEQLLQTAPREVANMAQAFLGQAVMGARVVLGE